MGFWLNRLIQAREKYHLDNIPELAPIIGKLQYGPMSEGEARLHFLGLGAIMEEREIRPDVTRPPPDAGTLDADGPVEAAFATLETGEKIGFRPLQQVVHALACGVTGAGKSVLLRRLIRAIRALCKRTGRKIVIIVLDPKRDYTDVRLISEGPWLVLDAASTLRIGLQRPAGVQIDPWINLISSSAAARMGLIAARIGIARILRLLVTVMSTPTGPVELWPNWRLVLEVASAHSSTYFEKEDYGRTARQMLTDAVENSGDLFECFRGFDASEAVAQGTNVVIAMDQLTLPWLRAWLVDLICSQVFYSRLASGRRVDCTEVILIIDESDEFASAEQDKVFSLTLSPIGRLLKQGRELGIMCVLSASVLRNLSPFVLSNTTDHILFNQADQHSVVEARNALMLPPEGDVMISTRKRGQCLIRQGLGSYPHTVSAQVDFVPPYRGIPLPYDSHPFVPSRTLEEMPPVKEALNQWIGRENARRARNAKQNRRKLLPAAQRLLELAAKNPCVPISGLWRLGQDKMSPDTKKTAVVQLRKLGLIECESLRVEKTPYRFLAIQPAGWEWLGQDLPKTRGRGGIAHVQISHRIAGYGRSQGLEAEVEWLVPGTGHHADVAWQVAKNRFRVFEVVIDSEANLTSCLQACFASASVESVTVVAAEKARLRELRRVVESVPSLKEYVDRISYESISTYMKEV